MKSGKEFLRDRDQDTVRKAAKLDPIRRSGKERHHIYKSIDSLDDDDELYQPIKKESVLDYLDDDNND